MLKLKLQYFGYMMQTTDSLEKTGKDGKCWGKLKAGEEGDNRIWDNWMASPTQWTWVWASSGSWWWTGRPGVLQFMGSERVGQDWATEQQHTCNYFHFSIIESSFLFIYLPLKLAQTHVHWVSHLILCRPLLLLPSVLPSIRVFSKESALRMRRPKYWSFSFIISPSNEYSGLISFRIDWFDFLAVQGTLKSLLQYHSSKASILQCSAFFIIDQLSHPWMTIGKTITLTRQNFAGKLMCLLFNMLSRLVIAFLPKSYELHSAL